MTLAVASVGECMLELSGHTGDIWRMGYAGDTLNTLWTMRALSPGHHIDYVSAFGDDPFSQAQIAFLRDHGIGIAESPIIAGARPGLYAITLTGAERAFTYWRSDSAARRLASDAAGLAKSLANRALIYFSGITLAILDQDGRRTLLGAIAAERAKGSHIAFDPNYRPRLWPDRGEARAAINAALGVCDIVLPTQADEAELFGDADIAATLARLEAAGIAEIVVKQGDGPAVVSHYDKTVEVPASRVETPVDTTGAGDAFNGAYLSGRLIGIAPAEAAKRAHHVAAAVVQVRGALAPPDLLKIAFDR